MIIGGQATSLGLTNKLANDGYRGIPDYHRGLLRESVTQLVKYATRGTAFAFSIWVCHVNSTAVFRLMDSTVILT